MVWSMWWRMFFILQVSRDYATLSIAVKYETIPVKQGCRDACCEQLFSVFIDSISCSECSQDHSDDSSPGFLGFFFCHIRWCICNMSEIRSWNDVGCSYAWHPASRTVDWATEDRWVVYLIWFGCMEDGPRPSRCLAGVTLYEGGKQPLHQIHCSCALTCTVLLQENRVWLKMWDTWCYSDDTCRPPRGPQRPPGPAEEADQIHSHQGREKVHQIQ